MSHAADHLFVLMTMRARIVCAAVVFLVACASGIVIFRSSGENDTSSVSSIHIARGELIQDIQPTAVEAAFLVVGDMMLGRYVETLSASDPSYPFQKVHTTLASVDAVIGNLEGPVPDHHSQTPNGVLRFSFPQETPETLASANVGVVTIANNHMLDAGSAGRDVTRARLIDAGVTPFGDPQNDAVRARTDTTIRGVSFVLIGLNDVSAHIDQDAAEAMITSARSDMPSAVLIVSVHWGSEYQTTANQRQRDLARTFIDAGADMVLGHHPHVTQGLELYNGRLIAYSLGNFVFDQYFSDEVQHGLALRITVGTDHIAYEVLPLESVRSQSSLLDGSERTKWLSAVADRGDVTVADAVRSGNIVLTRQRTTANR